MVAQPEIRPEQSGDTSYHEMLQILSEASVDHHFDPFVDIPWDSPEYAVVDDDERWILHEQDQLGGHPWYQALPKSEQIRIGRYRYAQMCKTGAQFEQLLIAGIANYLVKVGNQNPEFRYATHEATEETNHTQMLQELANRVDPSVPGTAPWFAPSVPFIAAIAQYFPRLFFLIILAGEEPIDHVQKEALRAGDLGNHHPLLERVVQIHVAEEARHIGFAHAYLHENVPQAGRIHKAALAVMFPIVLRIGCDAIMKPTKQARRDMGIPDEVYRELWWQSGGSKKVLRDLFGDVRMLAEDLGMRGALARRVWRWCGIDGRPSRYRAEPPHAAT